jgi:hypothetical protein
LRYQPAPPVRAAAGRAAAGCAATSAASPGLLKPDCRAICDCLDLSRKLSAQRGSEAEASSAIPAGNSAREIGSPIPPLTILADRFDIGAPIDRNTPRPRRHETMNTIRAGLTFCLNRSVGWPGPPRPLAAGRSHMRMFDMGFALSSRHARPWAGHPHLTSCRLASRGWPGQARP